MDWDKLRIFHAVASAGSFTHAGQMLTLSQSAVSRQISALEEEIVTPLFQRHARGLTLTDEGELLYGAVSDVLTRLGQAEEALKNAQSAPRGSLKVTSSHGLGTYWLLPRLNEFLLAYPELQVHLVFEDHELDLAQREADLALRINNLTGILHAAEAGAGVAALPDYVAAGRPHLVRILPEVEGPTFDVHLVYCDALRQSKRVAAFRDFLVRAAKDWKY